MKPPSHGRPVAGNDWPALDGEIAPEAPAVSVIVVHYAQPRQLARTLRALERQRYPGSLEVIVVDDGSAEPPGVPGGVQLIRQSREGARRSAARNRGVLASHGEVLCFLDADTVPEPDYVAQLTRLPALAPEAVTVGRRRHARLTDLPLEAEITQSGPAHELASPRWLEEGYRASRDLRDAGPGAFRYMISAVLSCTRWFWNEVGGFDESFEAYGGEDWEWAHRAWLRGAVFAHVPAAAAWHDGPAWEARGSTLEDRAAARAEKNAEAMRLAQLVGAPGQRPHGLLARRAEVLITFADAFAAAAMFICVDSLLAVLANAAVRVPAELAPLFGDDPRVLDGSEASATRAARPALHITVHGALTVSGAGLSELCRAMLEADDGLCHLCDEHGELMTIESARHRARLTRWGATAGLGVLEQRPGWLQRLTGAPDVEAYLGGWER